MSQSLPPNVHISSHPCLQAKLSQLRDAATNSRETKALVHEISLIVGCEALAAGLSCKDGPPVRLRPLSLVVSSAQSLTKQIEQESPRTFIYHQDHPPGNYLSHTNPAFRFGYGRRYFSRLAPPFPPLLSLSPRTPSSYSILIRINNLLIYFHSNPNPSPGSRPNPPPRPLPGTPNP